MKRNFRWVTVPRPRLMKRNTLYNARCETTQKAQKAPCVRPSRWLPSEGSKGPWASTAWPSSPSRAELGQHGVDMGLWDRVVKGWFTWLFVADSEVVLKVCVLGKQRYWLKLGNRFDAFVTLAALLASLCVPFGTAVCSVVWRAPNFHRGPVSVSP